MGHLELDFRAIPRLHGKQNYWQWRILLKTYLEANDLWKHNEPKECPQTKFLILASVEGDKIEPAYDDQTCSYVFQNLESRFGPYSNPKLNGLKSTISGIFFRTQGEPTKS